MIDVSTIVIQRQLESGVNESNNRQTMPIRAHALNLHEDFLPALQRPQTHNDYEERLDAQNPYEIDVQKIPNMTPNIRRLPK